MSDDINKQQQTYDFSERRCRNAMDEASLPQKIHENTPAVKSGDDGTTLTIKYHTNNSNKS